MTFTDHADNEQKSTHTSGYSDVLERCLQDIADGRATIEACVARYPQFAELDSMLRAVSAARNLSQPVMPPADKAEIRQLALTRLRANSAKQAVSKQRRLPLLSRWQRFALIATAIILFISASGISLVNAASTALPNDVLYVFKRVDEQIELSFAADDARSNVLGRIAQARLDEIDSLMSRNRPLSNAIIVDASSSVLAALMIQTDTAQRNQLYARTANVFTQAQQAGALSLNNFNSIMTIVSAASASPTNTPASTEPVSSPTPTTVPVAISTATSTPTPTATETETPTAVGTDTETPTLVGTETPDDDGVDGTPGGKGRGPVVPTRKPTQKPQAGGNGNGNGGGNGGGNGKP